MSDRYLTELLTQVIRPIHDGLQADFGIPGTLDADCLSLAIKIQESGKTAVRDQGDPAVTGPATGQWQFEKGGGIWEILNLAKISPIFKDLCGRAGVRAEADVVWRFFTTPQSDELAAAAARLLIYLDPAPIPAAMPVNGKVAYDYYKRRWRPGADRERAWMTDSWPTAVRLIQANPRAAGAPALPTPAPAPAPGAQPAPTPSPAPGGGGGDQGALERRVASLEAWRQRVEVGLTAYGRG